MKTCEEHGKAALLIWDENAYGEECPVCEELRKLMHKLEEAETDLGIAAERKGRGMM